MLMGSGMRLDTDRLAVTRNVSSTMVRRRLTKGGGGAGERRLMEELDSNGGGEERLWTRGSLPPGKGAIF
jgi:hypothetical protein